MVAAFSGASRSPVPTPATNASFAAWCGSYPRRSGRGHRV